MILKIEGEGRGRGGGGEGELDNYKVNIQPGTKRPVPTTPANNFTKISNREQMAQERCAMRSDPCIEYGWSCEEDLPAETLARAAKSEYLTISGSES
jgi:hypothetical protein